MKNIRLATLASVLVLSILAPACAKQPTAAACVPVVRDGWIRLVPGMDSMQAGFGRIENRCTTPATIVGARSPAHGMAELHETKIIDGVNRMRAVPQLRIAPDDAAVLKPGGLHLMLMEARAPLKVGTRVAIEFPLQDGRVVRGEFVVKSPAE